MIEHEETRKHVAEILIAEIRQSCDLRDRAKMDWSKTYHQGCASGVRRVYYDLIGDLLKDDPELDAQVIEL